MIKVEEVEKIRRAYYLDELSIREIARTLHHGRRVIRRAIDSAEPGQYKLAQKRPATMLGALESADRCAVDRKPGPAAQAALHGAQDLPGAEGGGVSRQ